MARAVKQEQVPESGEHKVVAVFADGDIIRFKHHDRQPGEKQAKAYPEFNGQVGIAIMHGESVILPVEPTDIKGRWTQSRELFLEHGLIIPVDPDKGEVVVHNMSTQRVFLFTNTQLGVINV